MSASRNPDGPGVGTEFHSKIEPDEPMQTGGHQPGKKVGDETLPEFQMETLPAGSAPADKTFKPNTDHPVGESTNQSTSTSTLVEEVLSGADSTNKSKVTPGESSGNTSTSTATKGALPELRQGDAISSDNSTRPGTDEATPIGVSQSSTTPSASTALPESKQDSILSATDAARPGASEAAPVGVSKSASTERSNESLSENVKSSLDTLTTDSQSVLPQSINEQLPTTSQAAGAVKTAAASLVSGLQDLVFGASETVAENASASHPESNVRSADDLHVPGAFVSGTTDAEDKAAVQRGLQSVQDTLPSSDAVKESVQSVQDSLPTTQGVKDSLQSAQANLPSGDAVLPNTNSASRQLPNIGSNDSSVVKQAQGATATVQNQAQQAVDYVKEQLPGQQTTSQTGADHIIRDQHTSSYGTTSQLAGNIPFETSNVPQVVTDSQRLALASPEASSNPEAVQEKRAVEQELKREVPLSTTSGTGSDVPLTGQKSTGISTGTAAAPEAAPEQPTLASNVSGAVTGTLAGAGAAIAGAATFLREKTQETTGTDPVSVLPVSAQQAIDGEASTSGTSSVSTGERQQSLTESLADGVSATKDSLLGAASSASNTAADAASSARNTVAGAASSTRDAVANTGSSASEAVAGATSSASNTVADASSSTRDAVANAASSTSEAITGATSAAYNTVADAASSTLDAAANAGSSASEAATGATFAASNTVVDAASSTRDAVANAASSTGEAVTGAASSASSTGADAASYARQKTHETTGVDPVSALSVSAQKAIDGEHNHSQKLPGSSSTASKLDPEAILASPAYRHDIDKGSNPDPGRSSDLYSSSASPVGSSTSALDPKAVLSSPAYRGDIEKGSNPDPGRSDDLYSSSARPVGSSTSNLSPDAVLSSPAYQRAEEKVPAAEPLRSAVLEASFPRVGGVGTEAAADTRHTLDPQDVSTDSSAAPRRQESRSATGATALSRDTLDPERVLSTPAYGQAAQNVPNTDPAHAQKLDSSFPRVVGASDPPTSGSKQDSIGSKQSHGSAVTFPRVVGTGLASSGGPPASLPQGSTSSEQSLDSDFTLPRVVRAEISTSTDTSASFGSAATIPRGIGVAAPGTGPGASGATDMHSGVRTINDLESVEKSGVALPEPGLAVKTVSHIAELRTADLSKGVKTGVFGDPSPQKDAR